MPEGKSDDLMEAAIRAVDAAREDMLLAKASDNTYLLRKVAISVVHGALLAERQRCISICDAEREWGDFHPDDVTGRIQRGDGPRQIPGWNCPYEDDAHD